MDKVFNCSTCWNMQYELLNGMFFDTKEETKDYILCTSKVMDDYFWNMAYLKTKINESIINEIERKLKVMDRIPAIYIGRDDQYYDDNKRFILDNGYKLNIDGNRCGSSSSCIDEGKLILIPFTFIV